MKCTLHLYQAAPMNTLAMAALSPRWWSEITRRTPPSYRARNERKNSLQNTSSSVSPTAQPNTSRSPVMATPVTTTTARETTWPPDAPFRYVASANR